MNATSRIHSAARVLGAAAGAAAVGYGAYAGLAWLRYGHAPHGKADDRDELLDRFMPSYDVVERHHVRIAAPAGIVLAAAKEQSLFELPIARTIFKAREVALRARPGEAAQPRGLLAAVQWLGWGVLADVPGREIVVGGFTRPWEANVTFHALPPDEFAAFSDPGYVKIVWTLRADPVGDNETIFRTETRAIATDAEARSRFRRYWAFASPGIAMIRWLSLGPLKRDAERRALAMCQPAA